MTCTGRSASEWFDARANLNHDFLVNRILVALSAARDDNHPPIDARPFLQLFVVRAPEIARLFEDAADALRPSRWLDLILPLDPDQHLDRELSEFLDQDFIATSRVHSQCVRLSAGLANTICVVRETLDQETNLAEKTRMEIEGRVREISCGISALPGSLAGIMESMW